MATTTATTIATATGSASLAGATAIAGATARMIDTNGVRLNVVEAGPEHGELVVLLHGFPEFSYGWRRQIGALAAAGFRVMAPDQRGYNLSDKPRCAKHYAIDTLARDVTGLIEAAGRKRAFVAGHDWGAAVTWWLANAYPEKLKGFAVLNVPHHQVFLRNLATPSQLSRSWYMFFFQLPWLPEQALLFNGCEPALRGVQRSAHAGAFSDEDLEHYRRAWQQPGAMRGMLNWYRAAFRTRPPRLRSARIEVPAMILWGKQDAYLKYEMAGESAALCDKVDLFLIERATHWVQHEEAGFVNEHLIEFFRRHA